MGWFFRAIRRALIAIGVAVLFVAAALAGVLWFSLPREREDAAIPGLSAPVTINFDADGVPRIQAASATDAAAALGYAHARDRMFQMELMRRNASGRLSEIVGTATLPLDRQMRVLGLRRRALADLDSLAPDTRAMLEAYARGVNAWIAAHGRFSAPEFLLLGAPEPWAPVDSLLWGKTMGLWLSENWRMELARLSLAGQLPEEQINELWPSEPEDGRPDASRATNTRYADAARRVLEVLPRFPERFTSPASASNEWAVDGRHTATGAPLLAGDPHLAFGFPGIWYLARIETPDGVLAGATAPGVPFLILGHNGHIAWTFTTTGADVQDVFIETPVSDGTYQTPDGPQPFLVHEERIRIRGQPDQILRVRETRHGPVISDLRADTSPVLAVAMANLAPGDTAASGILALNRAKSVEDVRRAAEQITSPVQNLLVADRDRIALYVTGRIPIRRAGDGRAPVPGADGAHDWVGWAAGDRLPQIVAPESGRLVNANERIAPPDFPVFLGRDWFGDWRARRIRQMLDGSDRHSAADFAKMQLDPRSAFAQQILPAMLAIDAPDGLPGRALALLRDWDGRMAMDLPQPLIFNAWVQRFRDLVLHRAGVPHASAGPTHEFVAFVLSPDGAHWCGGTCKPILAQALQQSVADLASRFGEDPGAWRWGEAHPVVFAHPILGRIPLIRRFAAPSIATPGDDTTVGRGGLPWEGFQSVEGPSYRGVYDLADLDRSLFIVAPGQSGNLFSRHAKDFLQRWRDGDTILLGSKAETATATIRLNPP